MAQSATPIIAGTRIGHVHLKVADLDRALGFYCDVLGFELMQRMSSGAAFISAGGYHHRLERRDCFTPLSSIPPAPPWPMRYIAWSPRASLSTAPAITASAKRFTC